MHRRLPSLLRRAVCVPQRQLHSSSRRGRMVGSVANVEDEYHSQPRNLPGSLKQQAQINYQPIQNADFEGAGQLQQGLLTV
jgi:hypothetical protein